VERIVVVGASLAGLRAAETLRGEGFAGELIVVGEEPHPPYNRPPLSKELLAGEAAREDVHFRVDEGLDVAWRLGHRAHALDLASREVELEGGERIGWDGLVLACGSAPRVPAALAAPLEGVYVLRGLDDSLALGEALRSAERLVVVGAGFIGCEVASTARKLGVSTTMVDLVALPLAPALGPDVAAVCAEMHRDAGVELVMESAVAELVGDEGRLTGVRLADGRVLDADLAVLGLGAAPCTAWLEDSGLELSDGVVCDERLRAVGAENVVAAGDLARWPHGLFDGRSTRVEHWTNAVEQGMAAARSLLQGDDAAPYAGVPSFWSDQHGVRIQSVGLPALGEECVIVDGSVAGRDLLAVYGREGRTVGAVALGSPKRLVRFRRTIAQQGAFAPEPLGTGAGA
jgi:NADPH-dependent 2,4-dienoyl-CoA reductase/sulfur reductase-like enzyme